MDVLLELIRSLVSNELAVRLIFVLLIGIAIFGFVAGVSALVVAGTSPVRRRLGVIAGHPEQKDNVSSEDLARIIKPVSGYILPSKEKEREHVRERLIHGGFRSEEAMTIYYAIKTLLALILPAIVLTAVKFVPTGLTTTQVVFATVAASFVGMMSPNYVLNRIVKRRKKRLRNGFPDALDLLVVTVESGLGLAAAIQRVSGELSVSHPELAAELSLVNLEIRAGVDRVQALKNLAERTGLEDIRGLVAMLAQSMRFGTSIAETLRVYSEEFRDKRMQAAEEMAAKIGTKLIFPLTFCLFPGFFIVAIGPAIIKIFEAIAGVR